jgi:protein-L-isoaspartate(D-aspartate) O-methyltransferase
MHQVFDRARENMVNGQILPNRVNHPGLVAALKAVPREKFLPRHLQNIAYVDEDIAVGGGRYLPEPVVLARLVQAAGIMPTDVVLDIGCGTGYSSAILGQIAGTVLCLEHSKEMAAQAEAHLKAQGVINAAVIYKSDLTAGYKDQGPYDAILINGSVPVIPDAILAQLAAGGRLVTVLSKHGHMGIAVLVTRTADGFIRTDLFDAATPTLAGFELPDAFSF